MKVEIQALRHQTLKRDLNTGLVMGLRMYCSAQYTSKAIRAQRDQETIQTAIWKNKLVVIDYIIVRYLLCAAC